MPDDVTRSRSDDPEPIVARLRAAGGVGGATRGENRARLITAAVRRLPEYGFHGVSIRDIAGDVGITPAGFYAHFRSKGELFWCATVLGYADFLVQVVRDGGGAPPRDRFLQLCRRHQAVVAEDPSGTLLATEIFRGTFDEDVPNDTREVLTAARSFYFDVVRRAVRDARRAAGVTGESDVSLLAEAVLALCDGLPLVAQDRNAHRNASAARRDRVLLRLVGLHLD